MEENIEKKHKIEESSEHVMHAEHHQRHKKETIVTMPIILLMVAAALLLMINQFQINSISGIIDTGFGSGVTSLRVGSSGGKELKISLDEIKSTGHTLAAVFPVEDIKTQE